MDIISKVRHENGTNRLLAVHILAPSSHADARCLYPPRTRCLYSARMRCLAALLVALAIAMLAIAMAPSQAHAKYYECPSVSIDATAQPDGTLTVSETRTFSFSGDFTAVWWTFENFPSSESELMVDSVFFSDTQSGATEELSPVTFQLSWREEGGPGISAYSVDEPRNTVYVFFNASDVTVDITINYHITNFVQVYNDVAELYWQYIGHGWDVDSSHVVATVHLPIPAGEQVRAGDNVRAWAHGPLDGALSIGSDGSLSMTIPSVGAGGYAEVRSTFPSEWMTSVSSGSPILHAGSRLDAVLEDESRLATQANVERMRSLALIVVCLVISVCMIAWGLITFFRHGKEYKPQFQDQYWRDVPEPGLHPAVAGRLWRWDAEKQEDFTATLMHLSRIGAIRLDAGSYQAPAGGVFSAGQTVNDYYITRLPGWQDKVANSPIDSKAMDILFDTIAKGADSLWFGTIKQYGSDFPEVFIDMMEKWQGIVSAETNKRNFFEAKGGHYQALMAGVAVVALVLGLIAIMLVDNFIPLIALLPGAAVLFVLSVFMKRRSKEAVELHARCEALRSWLKDFSSLDERPPTDVKVWGELMVFAFVLGVANEAIRALQMRVPSVVSDPEFAPLYYWYMPHYYGMGAASVASPVDTFASMQTNTISAARAAISAASDDSGAGGGFSGGSSFGGGGFGGGGGGAR